MALIKGKTLVEQTTDRIIDYIAQNKMQPGQQLPTEAEFTAELGVSRGTLRDAFKVLIARNILEARQGSGTFIAQNMGIPDDPLGLTFIYDDEHLATDYRTNHCLYCCYQCISRTEESSAKGSCRIGGKGPP